MLLLHAVALRPRALCMVAAWSSGCAWSPSCPFGSFATSRCRHSLLPVWEDGKGSSCSAFLKAREGKWDTCCGCFPVTGAESVAPLPPSLGKPSSRCALKASFSLVLLLHAVALRPRALCMVAAWSSGCAWSPSCPFGSFATSRCRHSLLPVWEDGKGSSCSAFLKAREGKWDTYIYIYRLFFCFGPIFEIDTFVQGLHLIASSTLLRAMQHRGEMVLVQIKVS